jgi:hypothetical protein
MEYFRVRRHYFLLSSYCRRPPTLTDTQQVENSEHKVEIKGPCTLTARQNKQCTGYQKQLYKQTYLCCETWEKLFIEKYTVDLCSFCTNIGFAGFNHYRAMLDCPWPSVSDWPWCWNADDYTLWLKHYAGWDFTYYGMQFDCCGGDTRYSARI